MNQRTLDPLGDDDAMPCGAHQGTKMRSVPADYLDFLAGQQWLWTSRNPDWIRVRQYIRDNLKAIQDEIPDDD